MKSRMHRRGPPRAGAGFTVLEVLAVLALLGLLAGGLAVGVNAILPRAGSEPLEHRFWEALAAGRQAAVLSGERRRLRWDAETEGFVHEPIVVEAAAAGDGGVAVFPPRPVVPFGRQPVRLVASADNRSRIVLGGRVSSNAREVDVVLRPDGTCTAFAVEFDTADGLRRIDIDPWTGARKPEAGR